MNPDKIKRPLNLAGKDFVENKQAYYKWLREDAPVCKGRMSVLKVYFVSRYADCVAILKDDRFVRNRTTATGGSPLPVPVPKSVALLMNSMIAADGTEHRRLRNLVHMAFTPGLCTSGSSV